MANTAAEAKSQLEDAIAEAARWQMKMPNMLLSSWTVIYEIRSFGDDGEERAGIADISNEGASIITVMGLSSALMSRVESRLLTSGRPTD